MYGSNHSFKPQCEFLSCGRPYDGLSMSAPTSGPRKCTWPDCDACNQCGTVSGHPSISHSDPTHNGYEAASHVHCAKEMAGPGEDVDKKSCLSYTFPQKGKKGKKMSLIVVLMNKNGIAMAADSRSSVQYGDYLELDTQFPTRKKIFTGKTFILGAYGANSFEMGGKRIPVESVIDECVSKENCLSKTMDDIYTALSKYSSGVRYDFVAGYKDGPIYCCKEFFVLNKQLVENCILTYHQSLIYGYADMASRNIPISNRWRLEEMETRCRAVVESAIQLGDLFLGYNPVGGEVRSCVFS